MSRRLDVRQGAGWGWGVQEPCLKPGVGGWQVLGATTLLRCAVGTSLTQNPVRGVEGGQAFPSEVFSIL